MEKISHSGKISLYVVEDYYLTRLTYVRNLNACSDFEVFGDFSSAEECIEALKNRQSSTVLMDLGLPGMNGIEATKIITDSFPSTKVIVLTSHDKKEELLACAASGASGYILKDSTFDMVKKVVKMVNMGAMWFDPGFLNFTKDVLPKPNSTNFDNLYDKGLKSILTDKEYEVLELLEEGYSNTEIAKLISISVNTVKAHVGNILLKLRVSDRVQAAVKSTRAKLLNF